MYARLLLLPLAVMLLTGADWMRFRGPNGAGVSADKDIPVKWTAKDILWSAPLAGTGHSSPIVVKGKVFLETATKKDRLLVCIDAVSGKELWSKAAPGGIGKTHRRSSLASSTPCSDGERVYCVFWDGKRVGLFAYDLTGKTAWKTDLGAFTSQHGPGFSPIVHDGKVIINNDQDGTAVLRAFHAKDGKPAWEVNRPPFRACYSTPFLYEQGAGGTELIVTSTAGRLRLQSRRRQRDLEVHLELPRHGPADGRFVGGGRRHGDRLLGRRLRRPRHDRRQARRQGRRDQDQPRLGKRSQQGNALCPHRAGPRRPSVHDQRRRRGRSVTRRRPARRRGAPGLAARCRRRRC